MTISRREFLRMTGAGLSAFVVPTLPGLPGAASAHHGGDGKVVVFIFLRFGADGLTHVVPDYDPGYPAIRPETQLILNDPDIDRRSIPLTHNHYSMSGTGELNDAPFLGKYGASTSDFFTINHHLAGVRDQLFDTNKMVILHAVNGSHSHSHFEAQNRVDWGVHTSVGHDKTGWLTRALPFVGVPASPQTLSGVSLSTVAKESLAGSNANVNGYRVAFSRISQYRLLGSYADEITDALAPSYANLANGFEGVTSSTELLRNAGAGLFGSLDAVSALPSNPNGALYDTPDPADGNWTLSSIFRDNLMDAATLIRSDIGVKAIALDMNRGWDFHQSILSATPPNMKDLNRALISFYADLATGTPDRTPDVCTVVISEFGRTAYENGYPTATDTGVDPERKGTDHGNGGICYVIGGDVAGGRVLVRPNRDAGYDPDLVGWPGLAPGELSYHGDATIPYTVDLGQGPIGYSAGERDLADTIDFRDVYAAVLEGHLGIQIRDPSSGLLTTAGVEIFRGYEPVVLPDGGLWPGA